MSKEEKPSETQAEETKTEETKPEETKEEPTPTQAAQASEADAAETKDEDEAEAEAKAEAKEAVEAEAAEAESTEAAVEAAPTPKKPKQPKASHEVAIVPQADDSSEDFPLARRIAHVLRVRTDTQQWITLADTKGGLLLTANGVIAGFMTSQFSKLFKAWPQKASIYLYALLFLFICYGVYQLMSFLYTMWIILPRPMSMSQDHLKRTRHVFNYSLTLNFPTLEDGPKLAEEFASLTEEELLEEHVLQLHIDSIVCTNKYAAYMKAFRALQYALVFGSLAFAASVPITHKRTPKPKIQQSTKAPAKAPTSIKKSTPAPRK